MFDVWVAIVFGILGYIAKKEEWPIPPLILGFILGPMFEGALRPSLTKSEGSISIFFTHPISLGFIVLTFMLIGFKIFLKKKFKQNL